MNNRRKALAATVGFIVGNIVVIAVLTIAGRYGMARDLIAMIGHGVLASSGLITIGYILFQATTDAS